MRPGGSCAEAPAEGNLVRIVGVRLKVSVCLEKKMFAGKTVSGRNPEAYAWRDVKTRPIISYYRNNVSNKLEGAKRIVTCFRELLQFHRFSAKLRNSTDS